MPLAPLLLAVLLAAPADTAAAPPAAPPIVAYSRIDQAWTATRGAGAKVAVLDWLFDLAPAGASLGEPVNLVPGQPVDWGEPWHGAWMVELVHLVAPEAVIVPIQARPSSELEQPGPDGREPYEKYLLAGIRRAADLGCDAVTSSMGPLAHGPELAAAIDYAEARGTVFVDVHPEYVGRGEERLELCAPGVCDDRIVHAGIVAVPDHPAAPHPARDVCVWPYQPDPVFRDGWGYSNGPPVVGGVIALMRSVAPDLPPDGIRRILRETAEARDGFPVLDAAAAVAAAAAAPRGPGS